MKNPISIVTSESYQKIFNETFSKNNARFAKYADGELMIEEQNLLKTPFIEEKPTHKMLKAHNQIIQDSFAFWSDGYIMLGLVYSPDYKAYTGGVFLLGDEGIIESVGTNVFNIADLLSSGLSNIDVLRGYQDFFVDAHRDFGDFNEDIPDYFDIDDQYPDYNTREF
jgi:hypothetical protein